MPIGVQCSEVGEVRVYTLRNRKSQFPKFIGAIDREKDRWHESG
jgi:hypothetical protein